MRMVRKLSGRNGPESTQFPEKQVGLMPQTMNYFILHYCLNLGTQLTNEIWRDN